MNQEKILSTRSKMKAAADYPHEWSEGRVSVKKMAEYLAAVHPELHVELNGTSCSKDSYSSSGKIRFPGAREYTGYRLKVWHNLEDCKAHSRYGTIIDHNTTETYRQNWEVARKIIRYEERLKIPKCPECKENDEVSYNAIEKKYDCYRCSRSFGGD